MKLFFSITTLCILAVCFPSCKYTHAYERYVKELDSLKVVLQQSVDNFKTVDSVTCVNAYAKQYTYSTFIETHLKDTVSKSVAEQLQTFHQVGKGLQNYLALRQSWLLDAGLSITQLKDLSHDLKNGSIDAEEAVEFINEEKRQSEKIIEELKINTETIRKHLDLLTQTTPACEELIKQLNAGTLPQLVKPDINSETAAQ